MKLLLDTPISIPENNKNEVFYILASQHRLKNYQHKSKWSITVKEELNVFKNCRSKNWCIDYVGWGLFIDSKGCVSPLGTNSQNELLHFSKFVDSNKDMIWHGYPADYRNKIQDRPNTNVLTKMMSEGVLKKHQISKISQGIKCNL